MKDFPEVEAQMSQLGRPEDGTDPSMPSNLEFFVKLKPASEWPKDVPTLGALIDKMNKAMAVISRPAKTGDWLASRRRRRTGEGTAEMVSATKTVS